MSSYQHQTEAEVFGSRNENPSMGLWKIYTLHKVSARLRAERPVPPDVWVTMSVLGIGSVSQEVKEQAKECLTAMGWEYLGNGQVKRIVSK